MNELALFAGAGGGILGGKLLGWRTVCAVEIEEYCRKVLMQRQDDEILELFPIFDDVRTFDGNPWRGAIDVITGGFPCQDISSAGKGAGLAGKRSGLWFEMLRVIKEVEPSFVFIENSPNLRTRGLATVLQGLASLGYDARWCVLGAWHVGAPHRRNRMWILAHSKIGEGYDVRRLRSQGDASRNDAGEKPWQIEPCMGRVADGVAHRVDRLKALGNGQVPLVAATAWNIMSK